ncbi:MULTISPECIES: ROK family transcriptional regulator [unclassified Variovorax]|uniref:ROK family transcriptional regulator n=1 Tax=unclassified Variovorax TaxID=663243 RepID=UPI0008C7ACC8|nr:MULTISPECIES: ROK family transcriptional regulator [unclassified Variovorax]SEJ98980.1 Sugar kinase of the NBD/HSP70 family, may contain an N-terminal HTH domain [Variovorax sp. OK202]SFD25260.1 Sugar kinase of the NBD/HSP70 family, may contain an N-terminal HTH domain [Variovorax sp. OK212]
MTTIGDQQLLKRMNRSVLLRLLRAQPGLSRARLAAESGLTKSTVSLLVRELIDEDWLSEGGTAVADGLGRPSTPLRINVGVRALMGVEIAVETVRLVCVSLQGEVLYADTHALTDGSPAGVCAQVARMAAAANAQLKKGGLRVSSIGVCVPGAVDDCTGVVRFAPNLGWRNVSLLPALEEAFAAVGLPGVTVQLQNDADAAVLGEYEFVASEYKLAANENKLASNENKLASGEGEDPLIFVNCDVGVGAGVVLNDRLFTGAQGMAGEIGHTILELDGPLCSCGRRGCAEAFFGSRVLEREGADTQRAAAFFGVLLQNLWVTFNPRAIVLGGKACAEHRGFAQAAFESVKRHADGAGMPAPALRTARYDELAPAVGAAALALHEYLRPLQPDAKARRARALARAVA